MVAKRAPSADALPSCVYLTGGGARRPHARQRIAEHFGVEVLDLPVLAAVTHDLAPREAEDVAASGAVAVGTAMKVLGMDHAAVDLRKEEFRFARTFDQIKTVVATGATLWVLGKLKDRPSAVAVVPTSNGAAVAFGVKF